MIETFTKIINNHKSKILLLCFNAVLLSGCATTNKPPPPDTWVFQFDWNHTTPSTNALLKGTSGKQYPLSGSVLNALYSVMHQLKDQSRIDPQLSITASPTLNAFATFQNGRPVVGITLPMLEAIGQDQDALASILGHELAHLKLMHGQARKDRANTAQIVSNGLGVALGLAGVPLGGSIASVGVGLVNSAYSRDEEREADILGLQWAMNAGYSPCGSMRAMQRIKMQKLNEPIVFLSSHPGHDERIQRAQDIALKNTGKSCSL